MQGLLAGKLAVVTGASRGIGQAIAEAFAAESAHLVLTAEAGQEEELKKVLLVFPGQVLSYNHIWFHTKTQVIKPLVGLPVARCMRLESKYSSDRSKLSPFAQITAKRFNTMISTLPCF